MKTRNDRTMTNFADSTIHSSGALLDELSTHYSFGHSSVSLAMENGSTHGSGNSSRPSQSSPARRDYPDHPEHGQLALNLHVTFICLLQFLLYNAQTRTLMFENNGVGRQTAIQGPRLLEGLHTRERQRGNREMRTRVFNEVSRGDDEATLGVDTVNKLILLNFDGGLSYMFTHLTIDAHLIPPSDRVNMVYWALRESPMFAWTVRKCAESYNTRKRVLVVAERERGNRAMRAKVFVSRALGLH